MNQAPLAPTGAKRSSSSLAGRLASLWREISAPLLIVLTTRMGLFLLAYLSLVIMPIDCQPWIDQSNMPWRGFPNNLLLDGWARWDSSWYADIADHGYSLTPVGSEGQRNVAFFPFYPLVIGGARTVLGNSFLAGIVVSNLALVLAVILLYQLVKARFGAEGAAAAVLLLCVYPFSFYLSTVYSEGLFFLMVIAAFYFADRGWWWAASLCAMLAGATRLPGLALAPALGLLYLEKIRFNLRKLRPDVLWLALTILGPVFFAGYLWLRFGDPLWFIKASQVEGWWINGPNLDLAEKTLAQALSLPNLLTGNYNGVMTLNLVTAIFFAVSLILVFRKQPIGYGVFALLLIGFGVGQWLGLGRYVVSAFPVYIAWALAIKNRYLFDGVVVTSSLLLALLTMMYAHWFWVS